MISTHSAFKKLTKNGMSDELAEAVTEIIEERQDNLVTKSDLKLGLSELQNSLEGKISRLENNLEGRMGRLEGNIGKIRINQDWIKYVGVACLMLLIKIAFFG